MLWYGRFLNDHHRREAELKGEPASIAVLHALLPPEKLWDAGSIKSYFHKMISEIFLDIFGNAGIEGSIKNHLDSFGMVWQCRTRNSEES